MVTDRVLVTGGTGHIGVNLLPKLAADSNVTVTVREHSPVELLPEDIETVPLSFDSSVDPTDYQGEFDAVVHLARAGVDGVRMAAALAEDCGADTFVYTSTSMAHPNIEPPEITPYIERKIAGQKVLTENSWGFDPIILHPTYVIGPRDYRLSRFRPFRLVESNLVLAPPLFFPGRMNVVHIADVVDTITYCLDPNTDTAERYVVSGKNLRRQDLHNIIAAETSRMCFTPPVPAVVTSYVIAPVVDILNRITSLPATGEEFRTGVFLGWVPNDFEHRAPVSGRSSRRAVREAHRWYQEVGLLGPIEGPFSGQ